MRRSRLGFGFGCTLAAAAVLPGATARASEALSFHRNPAGKIMAPALALERIADSCAAYGRGFVRLHGSNTCLRIVGHIRVETTITPPLQPAWGTATFRSTSAGNGAIRSRLRLDRDFDGAAE